jgi:hypothetical protein
VLLLQGHGFAASYIASSAPQVKLPVCSGTAKLVQVVLRTRQYGTELSWLITRRLGLSTSLDAPSQLNIAMAGAGLAGSVALQCLLMCMCLLSCVFQSVWSSNAGVQGAPCRQRASYRSEHKTAPVMPPATLVNGTWNEGM